MFILPILDIGISNWTIPMPELDLAGSYPYYRDFLEHRNILIVFGLNRPLSKHYTSDTQKKVAFEINSPISILCAD